MRIDLHTIIEHVTITPEIHARLKSEIIKEIVDFLTSNPKYTLDHSRDPPWNHSGELLKVGEHFLPDLYTYVGDFLSEYSGNRTASFTSGYGWHHTSIEGELCGGAFALGNVYTDYFIGILKKEYNLGEDDADDAFSEIQDHLGDRIFELNEEIKKMPMSDLYDEPVVSRRLLSPDFGQFHGDILELIHGCDENSEVMLFICVKAGFGTIENKYTFDLNHLRPDFEIDNSPDSDYLVWCYLINSIFGTEFLPAVLTVKTPVSGGKTEIRTIRIEDGMIEPLTAAEVKRCYSTCSDCGAYQDPPEDYVFCEFNTE